MCVCVLCVLCVCVYVCVCVCARASARASARGLYRHVIRVLIVGNGFSSSFGSTRTSVDRFKESSAPLQRTHSTEDTNLQKLQTHLGRQIQGEQRVSQEDEDLNLQLLTQRATDRRETRD